MTSDEVGFIGLGTVGLAMVTEGPAPADLVERLLHERLAVVGICHAGDAGRIAGDGGAGRAG